MGKFKGLRAKIDDPAFIGALDDENVLLKKTKVEHEYPHCWRCKNPVIFRITHQWFFRVEDLREKMLCGNQKVGWVPDTAKHAYEAWIKNLKDNSISEQRYWGTPLPIWKCNKCEGKGNRFTKRIEKSSGKKYRKIFIFLD